MTAKGTVRVRLLVAVWRSGEWTVPHQTECSADNPGRVSADAHRLGAASEVWIEADIPLPAEPVTVAGRVGAVPERT